MSETQTSTPVMAAIAREWFAARVVFVAGFVVAIAFVGWWAYSHAVSESDLAVASSGGVPGLVDDGGQVNQAGFQLCRLAIATAQNFGVLPGDMTLAPGTSPQPGDRAGRYTCVGQDPSNSTNFNITFDLFCREMNNPNCVSLYSITKASDGSNIYQRHVTPDDPGMGGATTQPADGAPPPDGQTAPTDGSAPIDGSAGVDPTAAPADGSTPQP